MQPPPPPPPSNIGLLCANSSGYLPPDLQFWCDNTTLTPVALPTTQNVSHLNPCLGLSGQEAASCWMKQAHPSLYEESDDPCAILNGLQHDICLRAREARKYDYVALPTTQNVSRLNPCLGLSGQEAASCWMKQAHPSLYEESDDPCAILNGLQHDICLRAREARKYDYVDFTVGVPLGLVTVIPLDITRDQYNNWYFSFGGSLGPSMPGIPIVANLSTGTFLRDQSPAEPEMQKLLSGHTVTLGGGAVPGAGLAWQAPELKLPSSEDMPNTALEVGVYTPQFGISYTHTTIIYDAGNPEPWIWQRPEDIKW